MPIKKRTNFFQLLFCYIDQLKKMPPEISKRSRPIRILDIKKNRWICCFPADVQFRRSGLEGNQPLTFVKNNILKIQPKIIAPYVIITLNPIVQRLDQQSQQSNCNFTENNIFYPTNTLKTAMRLCSFFVAFNCKNKHHSI